MKKVLIYDTTLRDGTQGEGVSLSGNDKILIAEKLDDFGIDYIEGGWPGSNPKDISFFRKAKKKNFLHAKIAAFGSTRRANTAVDKDYNTKTLLEAETPVITIFGKSWGLHVEKVLRTSFDENLKMIFETVQFLKKHDREVIYDAEHFFDGYKEDPKYAIRTLKSAEEAGADCLVLCDTNGGTLPWEIDEIIKKVNKATNVSLGIHVHNDNGMSTANSIIAVKAGVVQIQGTINGYGERSGNADLCAIIPNLQLKVGSRIVPDVKLTELTEVSRFVDELANRRPYDKAPYVGASAFAHKAGMHVNAVEKIPQSFEHVDPGSVGNRRRILVSELSGQSNVLIKAIEFGLDINKSNPETKKIVETLKKMENKGYEFEAAEASFKLMMNKILHGEKKYFDLKSFRILVEKRGRGKPISEATVRLKVKNTPLYTAAEGDGPVNALDNALRKALVQFYPGLEKVHLEDFKVRVIDAKAGTAAKVRVFIESRDEHDFWSTIGVSENIMEASWEALIDSLEYKLLKDEKKQQESEKTGNK